MSGTIAKGFRKRVESFLKDADWSPTRLGLEALNDGSFVSDLRGGERKITIDLADKVLDFITAKREELGLSEGSNGK